MKDNLKQSFKEKKAVEPIKLGLKGYFAKKQVNDMKQEAEQKQSTAMFKVDGVESGLGHSSYLKLTLRTNFNEGTITLTIGENLGRKRVIISNYVLPESFTGPISDPDDADMQLADLKEKCIELVKLNANPIIKDSIIPGDMFENETNTRKFAQRIPFSDKQKTISSGEVPIYEDLGESIDESVPESEASMYFQQ